MTLHNGFDVKSCTQLNALGIKTCIFHLKCLGQNLLYVAVHEFGHSLGISHSKTRGAIMWPWAGEYIPNFKLQPDDIQAIQVNTISHIR